MATPESKHVFLKQLAIMEESAFFFRTEVKKCKASQIKS